MYDVIIIGKGPAGISAALYTVRSNLRTLIIGKNDSNLLKADKIDNYFGFAQTISGKELLRNGEMQVRRLGAEVLEDEVLSVEKDGFFKVVTGTASYSCKAVLLATGVPHRVIRIENLVKFEGMGVSYCTTCDGFFYNSRKVGVLGHKDFAVHEALELLTFTQDVTIYTNGKQLDVSGKYIDELGRFRVDTRKILKLEGDEFLEQLHFADGSSENIDGLFVAYESASSVDFARKLGILTVGNTVVTDNNQRTNLEGVFAAGDCSSKFRQISVAVGQGAVAGKAIIDYIKSL
ncbi:MAG: NAD(P)/FAD-dependent oxidoreductase [Clostridiaceae bacterium]|jgi:thioredoxin reductase (NADPH)|nr:NAD(P)/FAD-dependent oxidoreductase [Clostridiaceae bacterium]